MAIPTQYQLHPNQRRKGFAILSNLSTLAIIFPQIPLYTILWPLPTSTKYGLVSITGNWSLVTCSIGELLPSQLIPPPCFPTNDLTTLEIFWLRVLLYCAAIVVFPTLLLLSNYSPCMLLILFFLSH